MKNVFNSVMIGFFGLDSSQIMWILMLIAIPLGIGIIIGLIQMNKKNKLQNQIKETVVAELKSKEQSANKTEKTNSNETTKTQQTSTLLSDEVFSQLEKLAKLKEQGIITDEEFIEQKKKVLNN